MSGSNFVLDQWTESSALDGGPVNSWTKLAQLSSDFVPGLCWKNIHHRMSPKLTWCNQLFHNNDILLNLDSHYFVFVSSVSVCVFS